MAAADRFLEPHQLLVHCGQGMQLMSLPGWQPVILIVPAGHRIEPGPILTIAHHHRHTPSWTARSGVIGSWIFT